MGNDIYTEIKIIRRSILNVINSVNDINEGINKLWSWDTK
jgi:hypothetical protein